MKIIVTGGAGFIGSHIVDAYVRNGHSVTVIDNLVTGSKKNLNSKAKFYKADIRDAAAVEKVMKREKPEIVSHHAALISVIESVKNPSATLDVNIRGTANALIAFSKYGRGKHKKFIYASSAAVYGNPKKIPVNESADITPISTYGFSKTIGEELSMFYAAQFKFLYLIFRYTNAYGPRQKKDSSVVQIFLQKMRCGEQPIIFGAGGKKRDYLHVADIARANTAGLARGRNEIINLGWGKTITDRDVFETIAGETGFKKRPRYAPPRQGEIDSMALSPKKAAEILRWHPRIAFQKGILETIRTK